MRARARRCGMRGAAVAVALACCALVLAWLVAGVPGRAFAVEYQDGAAVAQAKELIAALPADPDAIGAERRAQVDEAAAAYDALSAQDRSALDSEILDKEQSYGRWLESAQWGLEAATETLDSSTTLADGDYSAYITSQSSMGKSNSERARSWTAVKLVAKGGKLLCTIRCDAVSALHTMRLAGTEYEATVPESGIPEFTVPMQANANLKFTVDANEIADSIAYEIQVRLDTSEASAPEVANAKELAAQARAGVKASWPVASQRSVRAAARELSEVAGKSGVKRVELELFQARLASAQEEARKAAAAAAAAGGKKTSQKGGQKQAAKSESGKGARSAVPATSDARGARGGAAGSSASSASPAAAGADSDAASATETGAKPAARKKPASQKMAKALEVDPGGANVATDPASATSGAASEGSASSGGASAEPNWPLLLGLGAVLLLVLGMVLRSVAFAHAMGAGRRGGDA